MFKRLLALVLVAAAAWYGYKNYGQLTNSKSGDVVVVNHSGRAVERIRISVGTQTIVVETLEDGATAHKGFQPHRDGTFGLIWAYRGLQGEREWTGGVATTAEALTNRFEFLGENNVMWTSEKKASR